MKYFLLALVSLVASSAFAADIAGTYKSGSFADEQPAVLRVAFSGQNVQVQILVDDKTCVPVFAPGTLVLRNKLHDVYELPVLKHCDDPAGFGDNRRLLVERNGRGQITSIKVRGSNGKVGWTYFTNK